MNLYEYQGREVFARHGVEVLDGDVATTAAEARAIAERIGGSVVVKAQVLTGGRGKAGGVKVAPDPQAAEQIAADILGMDIKGHRVERVLIAPAVDIASEIYLGIVLDRALRVPIVMASAEGGVDIEAVAAERPDAIVRVPIDPAFGLRPYIVRRVAYGIGLDPVHHRAFGVMLERLYAAYRESDATLTEINPLVITGEGRLVAIDSKVTLDNSGLFRHPELAELRDLGAETEAEQAAREAGLSYVDLDGSIGCMVNGAGLAMATMDVIKFFGGEPANFLDIGGGAQADKVEAAMRIILSDARVKSVLVNIFGGITRGDEVARGLLAALGNIDTDVPFVVRIVGTNAEEARAVLAGADLPTAPTLAEAARMAVAAAAHTAHETAGATT